MNPKNKGKDIKKRPELFEFIKRATIGAINANKPYTIQQGQYQSFEAIFI